MARPRRVRDLVLRYAAFAGIATLLNLAVQRFVLAWGTGAVLFALALCAGTGTGLLAKYLLDKTWIFDDRSTGAKIHGTRFARYTVTGVFTTAIFLTMETSFWLVGKTHFWREIGAVLGLTVGYVIKYQLDSRFVFDRQK